MNQQRRVGREYDFGFNYFSRSRKARKGSEARKGSVTNDSHSRLSSITSLFHNDLRVDTDKRVIEVGCHNLNLELEYYLKIMPDEEGLN